MHHSLGIPLSVLGLLLGTGTPAMTPDSTDFFPNSRSPSIAQALPHQLPPQAESDAAFFRYDILHA